MRFVVVIKTMSQAEKAGAAPAGDVLSAWAELYREMVDAGVLLVGGGLAPPDTGARVTITQDDVIVMDGPFAETKQLIAGVWVLQVSSREEALTWVRRIPRDVRNLIQVEVRGITEDADASVTSSPGGGPTGLARPEPEVEHRL